MRILAVDPGYDRVGIAILDKERGRNEVLLHSECYTTDRSASVDERILVIGNHVAMIISKYGPTALSIENVFFTNNQKTVISVSEAKGVVKYVAGCAGLSIHEYTPLQVKIALTGDGRAPKDAVAVMVARILGVNFDEKKRAMGGKSTGIDDEIDAIALGITHAACIKWV